MRVMTELSDNGPVGLRQCMARKSLLFHDLPKVSCLIEFGMVESTTMPNSIFRKTTPSEYRRQEGPCSHTLTPRTTQQIAHDSLPILKRPLLYSISSEMTSFLVASFASSVVIRRCSAVDAFGLPFRSKAAAPFSKSCLCH